MRNKNISLAILLVLIMALGVQAQTTLKVAAIDQDGKGLVLDLNIEIIEGKGRVLLSTMPFTGISAQHSQNTATKLAENVTGKDLSDKDVIFSFEEKTGSIDGESAGGAMAAGVIAEIEGKEIREDVVFSGTVDEQGRIGEVGAALQKAYAAAISNASILLMPRAQLKEIVVIERLGEENGLLMKKTKGLEIDLTGYAKEHWGLEIIGVETIEEAMEVYYGENKERDEEEKEYELTERAMLAEEMALARMALERIERGERLVKSLGNRTEEMKEEEIEERIGSAKEKIADAKRYLELGYGYPAANKAFQAEIDLNTAEGLAEIWLGEKTAEEMGREAREELEALEPGRKANPETMHWLVGAQERYTWAEITLEDIERANMTDEEKVKSLAVVKAWTKIAEELLELAGEGNRAFSSDVARIAIRELKKAEQERDIASLITGDRYAADLYIRAAEREMEKGWFVAATYDAIYGEARAFGAVGRGMPEMKGERSDWALHYLNNAKAAAAEGEEVEARAFARASERLEEYKSELLEIEQMVKMEKKPVKQETVEEQEQKEVKSVLYLIAASIGILLILPFSALGKKR